MPSTNIPPAVATDHFEFPLDARYPKTAVSPLYLSPKFEYAWNAKKLLNVDPEPGTPGYFAALTRIVTEPHIANIKELEELVAQGQKLFQALDISPAQLQSAAKAATDALSKANDAMEATWRETLKTVSPHISACPYFQPWLELHAEISAHGEVVNADWAAKSQAEASRLTKGLAEAGFTDVTLHHLEKAIEARVKDVTQAYTNQFAKIYDVIDDTPELQAFKTYERSLTEALPQVEFAPTSAPEGRGRNARLGVAPCADVVVRLTTDRGTGTLVGLIVPQDDHVSMKMLGGKCDPHYSITKGGTIGVEVDSASETALKEFMEETGADKFHKDLTLDVTQLNLLNELAPEWRTTLRELGCAVNDNKVIWEAEASKALQKSMAATLHQASLRIPVPDVRTTQHSGYSTTVFEAAIDLTNMQQRQLLTLLLTVKGGDDAAHYGFHCATDVCMQSSHMQIFADYLTKVSLQ